VEEPLKQHDAAQIDSRGAIQQTQLLCFATIQLQFGKLLALR